jgi:alkanesulfonate monooxygenase SsuD/methylene tetrahydromethanopterin reductase-like flavin-dependent oxidoreductase (luciferase family)
LVIIGDPERCVEKLERYASIGCDSVIAYMQFGQLQHKQIMESIELLGKDVIPRLDKRTTSATIA